MLLFDIGANIGKWSLENVRDSNRIVAVEALPQTYQKLVENCKHHDNITCINYAVCDNNNQDITFYEAYYDTLSTMNKDWLTDVKSRFYNTPYRETVCKTITINNLIEVYGLPDLIKVDVEGGEFECIKSLNQKVSLLCFEWAAETNDITFKCLDYLNGLEYQNFYIQKEDNYSFRPDDNDFSTLDDVKNRLSKMLPKDDWGMVWCK